jgi:hypothetical protein
LADHCGLKLGRIGALKRDSQNPGSGLRAYTPHI